MRQTYFTLSNRTEEKIIKLLEEMKMFETVKTNIMIKAHLSFFLKNVCACWLCLNIVHITFFILVLKEKEKF